MTNEEVIREIENIRKFNYTLAPDEVFDRAISALKESRSKGHWIDHPHEAGANWEYSMYECSECHKLEEYDSDFCPNCGADMRGE